MRRLCDQDGGCTQTFDIVPCPSNITNCSVCIFTYGSGLTTCMNCEPGFYDTVTGYCQLCPTGCATCSRTSLSPSCDTCLTSYLLTGTTLRTCVCSPSQCVNVNTSQCINCPTGCTVCTNSTFCTGCY